MNTQTVEERGSPLSLVGSNLSASLQVIVEPPIPEPASGVTGKQFGDLLVVQYKGDGIWLCHCQACGRRHDAGMEELNRGKVSGCSRKAETVESASSPSNTLGKRRIIKERLEREGYLASAKFTAASSKKARRTVQRIKIASLHRSFWVGLRNRSLTAIEDLGDGYWVAYCDRCESLKVRNEKLLFCGKADPCGCSKYVRHQPKCGNRSSTIAAR